MYQIDYQYLRPKKAQWLKRMYNTPFEEKTNLSVWEGDRATILPLREIPNEGLLFGRGGVLDAQQNYVDLSGIPDRIGKGYPCPSSEYRDETVVYCGYMVNHWGHFLVEATTRLWYALKENPTVDKYVFFLEENQQRQIKGNYQEFFQLLGIWDKLDFISQPTTYRHVIVPEISFQVMHSWSPEAAWSSAGRACPWACLGWTNGTSPKPAPKPSKQPELPWMRNYDTVNGAMLSCIKSIINTCGPRRPSG